MKPQAINPKGFIPQPLSTTSQDPNFTKFERAWEPQIDSFSGAAGGVVASLIFYPLENFRT